MHNTIYSLTTKHHILRQFYKQLQDNYQVTQVTVTNHSDSEQPVYLWGAHSEHALSDTTNTRTALDRTFPVGKGPTGALFNTASQQFVVLCTSDEVLYRIDIEGTIIEVIPLNTTSGSGFINPIRIAYNSNTSDSNYGDMAVACQDTNTLLILDKHGVLKMTIATGAEPTDVVFNTFNGAFYVANSRASYLTKVNQDYQSSQIQGYRAQKLTHNASNGDLLLYDHIQEFLMRIDASGDFKQKIPGLKLEKLCLVHSPERQEFCYNDFNKSELVYIDDQTLKISDKILTVNAPTQLSYDVTQKVIHVIDSNVNRLLTIDTQLTVVSDNDIRDFDAYALTDTVQLYLSSFNHNAKIFGWIERLGVTVNTPYYAYREDFQHNPTRIAHLKIIASGDERLHSLECIETSVSGQRYSKIRSLNKYHSPQNFGNISEVFDAEGDIIDGHTLWHFKIHPKQVVTFLIYHEQFEMYSLVPQTPTNNPPL